MSAPLYRIPAPVIASLHARGETVETIAMKAGTGRAHATQVLANKPGRGYRTRRKLADFLKPNELALLGWDALGQLLSETPAPFKAHDTAFGRLVYQPNVFHAERSNFPKTERPGPTPLPAVEPGLEAPEGPGTGGHKPLMQNRSVAIDERTPAMGLLPATLSATSTST